MGSIINSLIKNDFKERHTVVISAEPDWEGARGRVSPVAVYVFIQGV
jgi:hypothetical protein